MSDHRNPQDRLSNHVQHDNPDPFTPESALESLHLRIIQIEAIANAASEAVVQLPFPLGRDQRRVFDRVYALVTRFADEIGALLGYGDELVAELATYRRRSSAEAEAPVKTS
jgi:hypothetical protein